MLNYLLKGFCLEELGYKSNSLISVMIRATRDAPRDAADVIIVL